MKKIMAFVLVVMLVLFVTACAKTEEAPTDKIVVEPTETSEDISTVDGDLADIDSLEEELDFDELDNLDEELNFDI